NFTTGSPNITVNISVKNNTLLGPEQKFSAGLFNVTLIFDNATGNDFKISTKSANISSLKSTQNGNISAVYADPTGAVYFWTSISPDSLAEGLHTVTVYANHTTNNITVGYNNTQSITFRVDRTDPVVTVSCGGPYAEGATVTCTCTATDGNSGVRTKGFNGGSSTTETFAASVTKTSSVCTAIDYANNEVTGTGTYSLSSSSGGGSGGGGSGGGVSSGVTGQFEKKVWSSINAGETASVPVKNGVVGVTEVSFSVPETVHGAWVEVRKKEALPSSVASFEGDVYRNLEIAKGPALKDELIKEATVKFKVEKAWLAEKQLPKESVALHHYADGAWKQLPTQVGEDDGTYVHYTASTPGFSYFVIGEKMTTAASAAETEAAPAAEAAPATEEAPAAEEAPAMEKKGPSTGLILALVAAVVVIAAVVAYLRRRR
ncbi:PGF-pre-PGF domain-containing protein, partial [Candidatus Woesearchaeota archaeon]|nr:PGF-pre-PGF domain-containing protein [Candidatus Woesearchaeota archaeon]